MAQCGRAHTATDGVATTVASGIIDLTRYPLHDPESDKYKALVSAACERLQATGCASFPGFLTEAATAVAAAQAQAASPAAFVTDDTHNAYQRPGVDPAYPQDHVRNLRMRTRVASIAFDELDPQGPLKGLYGCDQFLGFVREVTSQVSLSCVGQRVGLLNAPQQRPSFWCTGASTTGGWPGPVLVCDPPPAPPPPVLKDSGAGSATNKCL